MTALNKPLENQRNKERISTRRPAHIFVHNNEFEAVIINLSMEGIGILTDQPLSDGALLKIQFSLPGYEQSSKLTLNGEVIHRTEVNQKCLFGIRFPFLSLHEKLVITGFINYHRRLD